MLRRWDPMNGPMTTGHARLIRQAALTQEQVSRDDVRLLAEELITAREELQRVQGVLGTVEREQLLALSDCYEESWAAGANAVLAAALERNLIDAETYGDLLIAASARLANTYLARLGEPVVEEVPC